MIKRASFIAMGAMLFTAACAPEIPDSAAGVGFDSYDGYRQEREAELTGAPSSAPTEPVIASETAGNVGTPTGGAVAAGQLTQTAGAGFNNPGISDEQNFDAVSSRESIESDAARLAQNRQSYVLITPTALPKRPADGRPNIVAYALATNNPVGAQLYERGATSENRYQRACWQFASPDLAQEEFLARGGPERDRLGVDPDGDGFACFWDPTPFRTARGG